MSKLDSNRDKMLYKAQQELNKARRRVERLSKTPEQHGHYMKLQPAATHPEYGESSAKLVCDNCGCEDGSISSVDRCPKTYTNYLETLCVLAAKNGWVEKQ